MGGPTKAMETQVPGPIVPNCRETPGGAHGETMGPHAPPLPLKGIDTYLLALNTAAKAEVRHAVMAIKHLSCLSLKRGALMS